MEIREAYTLGSSETRIYSHPDKRSSILSSPYTQTVKEFALAIIAGGESFEDNNELIGMAIQATDKLIEKVEAKL